MSGQFDPTAPLTPSGNLRRRLIVSRAVGAGATGSALGAVAILGIVVYGVASRGAGSISWSFLTSGGDAAIGGGIAPALIGTALIVAVATLMALPVGILAALYLAEFARADSRPARLLQLALDLLQGLPTIVVGIFAFGLMVKGGGHESGFAGSLALAIIELPLIARSTQEVLRLVPNTMRDAADALGVERWRTLLGVVLPAAAGGIATGTILAVARVAGETAPLLAVDGAFTPGFHLSIFGEALPNIPVTILELSEQPTPEGLVKAWGAALTLLALILIANIGARVLLARSRRRTTGQ